MSHTLAFSGSTLTIYVDTIKDDVNPIIAEHNILDADHSSFQYVGSKSRGVTIGFHLYGSTEFTYLRERVMAGDIAVYTNDLGNSGSYVLRKLQTERVQALNYALPWHKCTLDMAHLVYTGSLYYQE